MGIQKNRLIETVLSNAQNIVCLNQWIKDKKTSYFHIADRWLPFSRYYLFNNALKLPSGFIVSQSALGLSSSLNKLTANAIQFQSEMTLCILFFKDN